MIFGLNLEKELDELWCLLTQSLRLSSMATPSVPCSKRVSVTVDIQYSPQGIEKKPKWFKPVHFN